MAEGHGGRNNAFRTLISIVTSVSYLVEVGCSVLPQHGVPGVSRVFPPNHNTMSEIPRRIQPVIVPGLYVSYRSAFLHLKPFKLALSLYRMCYFTLFLKYIGSVIRMPSFYVVLMCAPVLQAPAPYQWRDAGQVI